MSEFENLNNREILSESVHTEELPHKASSPYRYFKTRLYGRLHFVKSVSDDHAHDPVATAALAKEFETGYDLDHPNIVKYLLFREGAIYEEYIDGNSLEEILDDGEMAADLFADRSNTLGMIRQLLDALAYLHSNGIVYLDIKPANIMISRIGHSIKLTDLGGCVSASFDLTPAFTRGHAAPEQTSGNTGAPAASTDLYQFSIIARRMLSYCGGCGKYRRLIKKCGENDLRLRPKDAMETIAEFDEISRQSSLKKLLWPSLILFVLAGALIPAFLSSTADKSVQAGSEANTSAPQTLAEGSSPLSGDSATAAAKTGLSPAMPMQPQAANATPASGRDSWESLEDESWISYNEYFEIPPDGHPLHDKIKDLILQRSVDMDVAAVFYGNLNDLTEKYRSQGLTYASLDESRRNELDRLITLSARTLRKDYDDTFKVREGMTLEYRMKMLGLLEEEIKTYENAARTFRLTELCRLRGPWRISKSLSKPQL